MKVHLDATAVINNAGRPPVGIVRVERELLKEYLNNDHRSSFFYYQESAHKCFSVDRRILGSLIGCDTANCSVAGGGSVTDYLSETIDFRSEDVVISFGIHWSNRFLSFIFREKSVVNFFYVQMIHDLIPTLLPEYSAPGTEEGFTGFILDAIWSADLLICNSTNTARDLQCFCENIGVPVPANRLIELGEDLVNSPAQPPFMGGEFSDGFAMYVSTIEPRKNHRLLFDIWSDLVDEASSKPCSLLFVGSFGWNMGDFRGMLSRSRKLRIYISVIENASDSELCWLYQNAKFTLYPSLYEGWGIPVGESLSAGTPCIASSLSALQEVSQGFARHVHPHDYFGWYALIKDFVTRPVSLAEERARIASGYKSRSWKRGMGAFRKMLDLYLS